MMERDKRLGSPWTGIYAASTDAEMMLFDYQLFDGLDDPGQYELIGMVRANREELEHAGVTASDAARGQVPWLESKYGNNGLPPELVIPPYLELMK